VDKKKVKQSSLGTTPRVSHLIETRQALSLLIDCLEEAHQKEIDSGHYGDPPETCTYCEAITLGHDVLHALERR
jgi:hypothetical protein